jgi:hypothetical protein
MRALLTVECHLDPPRREPQKEPLHPIDGSSATHGHNEGYRENYLVNSLLQINGTPLFDLLRRAAPHKAKELDTLISESNPSILLDSEKEEILLKSNSGQNTITIGVKCTCRLQAHSVAGGIFIAALGTPGYGKMSPQERGRLYAPADPFLTWAYLLRRVKPLSCPCNVPQVSAGDVRAFDADGPWQEIMGPFLK